MTSVSYVVRQALVDRSQPVITSYELFRLIWDIYTNPSKYPEKFTRKVSSPGYLQYSRIIKDLSEKRFIRADEDFEDADTPDTNIYTNVFRVSDVADGSGEEIACLVDPFCYISYLSALQYYGLTNRVPEKLMLATPQSGIWTKRAFDKTEADYGFDPNSTRLDFFRPLRHTELPEKLRRRRIIVHKTSKDYSFQNVAGSVTQIIEIGNLFLLSLENPEYMGGMPHIIEIWEENAALYSDQIISAVESKASPIAKVRAGYLLSEHLKLKDSRIDGWKAFAQRGGSRKLDPTQPYMPTFSEVWMISLNVGR